MGPERSWGPGPVLHSGTGRVRALGLRFPHHPAPPDGRTPSGASVNQGEAEKSYTDFDCHAWRLGDSLRFRLINRFFSRGKGCSHRAYGPPRTGLQGCTPPPSPVNGCMGLPITGEGPTSPKKRRGMGRETDLAGLFGGRAALMPGASLICLPLT